MNYSENSPKIKRETKNKIRVEFERTSWWKRFRLKYLTGSSAAKALWWLFRFVLLLGVSYVILQPFYTKLASSFMGREDFVDVTVKLIPKHPTLDTYKAIIVSNGYLKALLNTTILSVSCALLQTLSCSFVGYGFAKYKFKGAKLLFALVNAVNNYISRCGGDVISDEPSECWYWSSTEVSGQESAKAWLFSLSSGAMQETPKTESHKIRPIITLYH